MQLCFQGQLKVTLQQQTGKRLQAKLYIYIALLIEIIDSECIFPLNSYLTVLHVKTSESSVHISGQR